MKNELDVKQSQEIAKMNLLNLKLQKGNNPRTKSPNRPISNGIKSKENIFSGLLFRRDRQIIKP